jgi:hypothetical protein
MVGGQQQGSSTMDFLATANASDKRASRAFHESLFPAARERRERAEYEAHMAEQRKAAK